MKFSGFLLVLLVLAITTEVTTAEPVPQQQIGNELELGAVCDRPAGLTIGIYTEGTSSGGLVQDCLQGFKVSNRNGAARQSS